jgi:hypothetical protein
MRERPTIPPMNGLRSMVAVFQRQHHLGVFHGSWHCLPKYYEATFCCSLFILSCSGFNDTGPAGWQFLTLRDQRNGLAFFAFSSTNSLLAKITSVFTSMTLCWSNEIYLTVPMFVVIPVNEPLYRCLSS